MFDVGWTELLVIAVVLIVVVGPKDLPPMLRAFGKMTARMRRVAGEFRSQFDEALREADMEDVRRTISDAQRLNPVNSLREAMNPLRQMGNGIKADLQKATVVETKTEVATPAVQVSEPAMNLPETPPVVPSPPPTPVDVAISAATVETAKPKPVRKPRTKAVVVAEAPALPAVVSEKKVPARRAAQPKADAVKPVSAKAAVAKAPAAKTDTAPKKPRTVKKKDEA